MLRQHFSTFGILWIVICSLWSWVALLSGLIVCHWVSLSLWPNADRWTLSIFFSSAIKRISHTQSRFVSDFDSKVPRFSDNRSTARDRSGESCLIDKDKPSPLFRALALCLYSSHYLCSNLKKSLTHGWLYGRFRFRRTRCCMLTYYTCTQIVVLKYVYACPTRKTALFECPWTLHILKAVCWLALYWINFRFLFGINIV